MLRVASLLLMFHAWTNGVAPKSCAEWALTAPIPGPQIVLSDGTQVHPNECVDLSGGGIVVFSGPRPEWAK